MKTSLLILPVLAPKELLFPCISDSRIKFCLKESHNPFQNKELNCYMLFNLGHLKKKNWKKLRCDCNCGLVVMGICHRSLDIRSDLSGCANTTGKALEQDALEILQQHFEKCMC